MKKLSYLQDILESQAQAMLDFYKVFEDTKKAYFEMAKEDGGVDFSDMAEEERPDDFEEVISLHAEESGLIPRAKIDPELHSSAWQDYMETYATGEAFELHEEAFPPSEVLCEEDIDPDSDVEGYARGKPMGIPKEVWVHQAYAGTMIPEAGEK